LLKAKEVIPQNNMSEETIAPKDELNPEAGVPTETPETLGDVLHEELKEDFVPLKKFMGEKKSRQEAEAQIETLQAEIQRLQQNTVSGMPVGQINDSIKALAEKYPDVSPEFISEVISTATTVSAKQIRQEIEKDYSPKLEALERERTAEKMDQRFTQLFTKTIKDMPEYKGIVNKEAIKALALNPANKSKTMAQIIEETYGNAIIGKRSIEPAHASREPEAPNTDNPSTPEDWDKIERDPVARKKWAENAQADLQRYL
jgi:hypothetical protein